MLLPDNIHPENTVYFNSAHILKLLQEKPAQGYFELFQKVREIKKIEYPMFILCLDWLFLLSVVRVNNNGEVELCS